MSLREKMITVCLPEWDRLWDDNPCRCEPCVVRANERINQILSLFKQEIEKMESLSESEMERAIYIGLTKKRQRREIAIAQAQLQHDKDTLLRMME